MRKPFAVLAAAVLVLGVGGTATASTAAPSSYTLCVTSSTARYETTTKPCKKPEKRIRVANYDELSIPVSGQGPQGETGPRGPQGERGLTGSQGPAGPKGETGAKGPQGDRGHAGADGKDGAPGRDGQDASELLYLTLDLKALGVPGGKTYTCGDVDPNPAVFKVGNCKQGSAPSPSPTPTPAPSPSPTWTKTATPAPEATK